MAKKKTFVENFWTILVILVILYLSTLVNANKWFVLGGTVVVMFVALFMLERYVWS